ncbi:hypothetical protein NKI96_24270 [Mesorhizobium sp. M0292]|uniref:hypothetical protein n=1 Tax=Mesorhizobium sp. M0292 TaxID=2956929 RepID=UPI00333B38F5
MYLNLDGIPTDATRGDGQLYFLHDPQGVWRVSAGNLSYEIETVCVHLHDGFRRAIMKGVPYADLIRIMPQYVSMAGLNAEASVSRDQFQEFLGATAEIPELYRFLYLYDCQHLVASIQECTKEVERVLGEFYLSLNTESFFFPAMKHEDGIRYSSSPVTTKLAAYLGFIFIRLHSLLDYTVKVAFEAEHLRADFARYPKFSSANMQYGDRRHVSFYGEAGSLFEACEFMVGVEALRNHIIHDGLLDDMPKAYERIEGGTAVEKFVLFPDMTTLIGTQIATYSSVGKTRSIYGCQH